MSQQGPPFSNTYGSNQNQLGIQAQYKNSNPHGPQVFNPQNYSGVTGQQGPAHYPGTFLQPGASPGANVQPYQNQFVFNQPPYQVNPNQSIDSSSSEQSISIHYQGGIPSTQPSQIGYQNQLPNNPSLTGYVQPNQNQFHSNQPPYQGYPNQSIVSSSSSEESIYIGNQNGIANMQLFHNPNQIHVPNNPSSTAYVQPNQNQYAQQSDYQISQSSIRSDSSEQSISIHFNNGIQDTKLSYNFMPQTNESGNNFSAPSQYQPQINIPINRNPGIDTASQYSRFPNSAQPGIENGMRDFHVINQPPQVGHQQMPVYPSNINQNPQFSSNQFNPIVQGLNQPFQNSLIKSAYPIQPTRYENIKLIPGTGYVDSQQVSIQCSPENHLKLKNWLILDDIKRQYNLTTITFDKTSFTLTGNANQRQDAERQLKEQINYVDKTVFVWKWMDNDGLFKPYSSHNNNFIEAEFRKHQRSLQLGANNEERKESPDIVIKANNSSYKIIFGDPHRQILLNSNVWRTVRRYDESGEAPNINEKKSESEITWYWKDQDKVYKVYTAEASRLIESAYSEWKNAPTSQETQIFMNSFKKWYKTKEPRINTVETLKLIEAAYNELQQVEINQIYSAEQKEVIRAVHQSRNQIGESETRTAEALKCIQDACSKRNQFKRSLVQGSNNKAYIIDFRLMRQFNEKTAFARKIRRGTQ